MCGICGIYGINGLKDEDLKIFQSILLNSEDRGKDAFGFYANKKVFKTKGSVSEYIEKNKQIWDKWEHANFVLAHTRATTQGDEKVNRNNHPFETEDFVMAHNGTICNDKEFKFKTNIETDSVVIVKSIQKEYDKNKDIIKAINETTKKLKGSYACWLLHKNTNDVYLFRHNNPIEIYYDEFREIIVFASEKEIIAKETGIFRDVVNGFIRMLAFAPIEEHIIYKIDKEGLHNLGGFEYSYYYSTGSTSSCGYDYDEDDDYYVHRGHSKINSTMGNADIIAEIKGYGIDYYKTANWLQNFYNIFLTISNGKIYIGFDEYSYELLKSQLEDVGYTISPKNKTITITDVADLNIIINIIEETLDKCGGYDEEWGI